MITHEGDFREGMEVTGLDGTCLGTVGQVWIDHRSDPMSHDLSKGMPASVEADRDGYFLLRHEEDEFFVPFNAIVILFPGQNVTLGCTADECRERYSMLPPPLSAFRLVEAQTSR